MDPFWVLKMFGFCKEPPIDYVQPKWWEELETSSFEGRGNVRERRSDEYANYVQCGSTPPLHQSYLSSSSSGDCVSNGSVFFMNTDDPSSSSSSVMEHHRSSSSTTTSTSTTTGMMMMMMSAPDWMASEAPQKILGSTGQALPHMKLVERRQLKEDRREDQVPAETAEKLQYCPSPVIINTPTEMCFIPPPQRFFRHSYLTGSSNGTTNPDSFSSSHSFSSSPNHRMSDQTTTTTREFVNRVCQQSIYDQRDGNTRRHN